MKLILISFYVAFCNYASFPSTKKTQLVTNQYDSLKIVTDSIPTAKSYVGPSIEVQVKYNFILLDRFVIGDILRTTVIDNKPAEKTSIYPAGTVVNLIPTDKSMAIESMYVKFDNAPEKRYSESIRLSAKGNHTLVIKLRDQWGGEVVSDSINFKVLSY
jgi:hypothetical protein